MGQIQINQMNVTLLTKEALGTLKEQFPEWEIREKKIVRKIIFKNFVDAFGFMTKVAIMSEAINHHPDWSNSFSTVTIELTTHDLGGISNLDLELAKSINELTNFHAR